MSSIEGSSRAAGKGQIFKGVCGGLKGPRCGAGHSAKGNSLPPPLGVIEVIHVAPGSLTIARRKGMLTAVPVEGCSGIQPSEKRINLARESIAFDDDDLERTIQPHDDALVVTA